MKGGMDILLRSTYQPWPGLEIEDSYQIPNTPLVGQSCGTLGGKTHPDGKDSGQKPISPRQELQEDRYFSAGLSKGTY
jgi:hypothetical protein